MHLVTLVLAVGGDTTPKDMRWDGIYGAIAGAAIGGVVSAFVALVVVRLTQRGAERSTLAQESRAAAGEITLAFNQARQALRGMPVRAPYAERREIRGQVAVGVSDALVLHRPMLNEDALRQLVTQAQGVFVDLMQRCEEPERGIAQRPTLRGEPSPGRLNLWQAEALPVLSAYVTEVIEQLEMHRLGKPTPRTPPSLPVWPHVDPPLEATAGSSNSTGPDTAAPAAEPPAG